MIFKCTQLTRCRPLLLNLLAVCLLIGYICVGGVLFFYFESENDNQLRQLDQTNLMICIERSLYIHLVEHHHNSSSVEDLTIMLMRTCLTKTIDKKKQWSIVTAILYGFGILTTLGNLWITPETVLITSGNGKIFLFPDVINTILEYGHYVAGYGRIEPQTTSGRLFCVLFGVIGIPSTIIVVSHFGKYLEDFKNYLRRKFRRHRQPKSNENEDDDDDNDDDNRSTVALLFIMIMCYLFIGACILPLLSGHFDFLNGFYFAFLCFSANEFGATIPDNFYFLPITLGYICIGLAMSTIALDVGAEYVRKMHYFGRKLSHIANVKIWFGSKSLRVRELIAAIGRNMGVDEAQMMRDMDLEEMIDIAIRIKEGKLLPGGRRPPIIVEGIWPPELVPLFIKDGEFPTFADSALTDDRSKTTVKPSVRFIEPIATDTGDRQSMVSSSSAVAGVILSPDMSDQRRNDVSGSIRRVVLGSIGDSSSCDDEPDTL